MPRPRSESGSAGRWRTATTLTAAAVTLALASAILVRRASETGQEILEGAALFSVFTAPAVLALLSLKRRLALLLVAAVLSGTLSLLLVTLMPVLALPALVYAVAYVKQRPVVPSAASWLVIAIPLVFIVAGALATYLSTDTVCSTTTTPTRTATECGETTTQAASVAAIALTTMSIWVSFVLSTPRPFDGEHRDRPSSTDDR